MKNLKKNTHSSLTTYSIIKVFFDIDTVKSKSLIITLMALLLFIMFNIAFKRVHVTDPLPKITPISTKIIKELGPFAVKVRTGLFIKNLPEFDIIKNLFIIDTMLWFEYNADEIMPETIERFSFDKGTVRYKTPADIRIEENKIFAKYNVLFDIKCDLNYHKFPFEDHRIAIVLANNFVTPEEMYFMVDGSSFQIAPNIFPANWKLQDLNVDAGYQKLQLDPHDQTKKTENPKAIFIINIVKASTRKILIIFLPLFSAIFLSFFSFVMNIANVVGRFSIAISAVTALLGYRFVIEQMIPQVGYFTTTDEIYLFLLIVAFIIFMFQLLITRFYMVRADNAKKQPTDHEKNKTESSNDIDPLEKVNSKFFIITSIAFSIITSYLLLK
jgi:hypothetical protein